MLPSGGMLLKQKNESLTVFNIKMLSFYIAILTLGFFSDVSMETCPEAEDIHPCKCRQEPRYIRVTCSSDSLITLQQPLKSLTGKNNVGLSLGNFNISIPSNFFAGIGIKNLDFHSCRIDNLANDDKPVLLGLQNHLQGLGITDSYTVPAKLTLGHLKKLESLTLEGNNMSELRDEWFSNGPPFLKHLFIWQNNIKKIGSNVFSRLDNLVELTLGGNRFGPIQRSMFPTTAHRLKYLYLDDNALTDLPVDLFRRMPAIEEVSLQRNGITTLDERTWFPIWQQLSDVYLGDNNIVCDDRLNWMIKLKKRPFVGGACSAPEEFEGKLLEDLFENQ